MLREFMPQLDDIGDSEAQHLANALETSKVRSDNESASCSYSE